MKQSSLLVIGVDAADSDWVRKWAGEGHLPTFARLLSSGAVASIATPPAVLEGAIWPTFLVSSSPAMHGMFAYHQIKPGTYEMELGLRADRLPEPPFWHHLSRAKKKVAIVDVPFTRPLRGLNGIQVINWGAHDGWSWKRSSYPQNLIAELVGRFGNHPVPQCDARGRSLAGYEDLRDRLIAGVKQKTALLEHCLDLGDWDFFMGVFSESHCAGHQLWHFMEPGHPHYSCDAAPHLQSAVRDVYGAIDAGIDALIARAGPAAHVLVILSHGMGPYYHGSHLLDQVLQRLGVNEIKGENPTETVQNGRFSMKGLLWGSRRIVPARLRERLKSQLRGNLFNDLWAWTHPESNRWAGMRAFRIPSHDMTGAIRVNLKGREPAGLVYPGQEYEDLCREITEALLELENPETEKKAVSWVKRSTELYRGPRQNELPDLFVEWDHTAPIRSLTSSRIGVVSREYEGSRTGSHWPNGLLLGSGPDFQQGVAGQELRTVDLGPTVLEFFGLPVWRAYEGKSALALLQRGKKPVYERGASAF